MFGPCCLSAWIQLNATEYSCIEIIAMLANGRPKWVFDSNRNRDEDNVQTKNQRELVNGRSLSRCEYA